MTAETGPPRLLRVITRLNIGGPAQHAVLLTARLQRSGWPTALVVGRVEASEGDMADLAAAEGVVPIQVAQLRNRPGLPGDLAALIALYRTFRHQRPEIVHLHLFKARLLGGVAAGGVGGSVGVETFHGTLLEEYYRAPVRWLILQLERWLARRTDAVIAVSDAVAGELMRWRVLPRTERVHVIPLGLALEPFLESAFLLGVLRTDLGIGEAVPLVGTVGRLVPIKGLQYFLDAAAVIRREIPGVRFVVVGDGPLRPALERDVWGRGLAGQVHFVGWRRDLPRVYPDLDVVMLTSLHEGTPVSLIEAMAAGRAVVATRVGGVPDVVTDGATGVLVPPRDPDALAGAVVRLLGDEDERRRLGEAARRAVYPRFTIERLTRDMDAFYRALLAERGRPKRP